MKIRYYFIGLLFLSCFASSFEAKSSAHNIDLVNQIKPNPTTRSKPTSVFSQTNLTPIKLASVQFLTDGNQLNFEVGEVDDKTKCASLGYTIPVSKCSGAQKPSYLCSSEVSLSGATDYTTNCCNSNLYTVSKADSCGNNSVALSDTCSYDRDGDNKVEKYYRCACDRSRYPYSELSGEGCGSKGSFDVNNKCVAPDAGGNLISYYTSCCPSSYKDCTKEGDHLVGQGNSCRVEDSNGNITHKYEECVCSSSYDTICPDTMLINSSDTCTDNKGKFTRDNNCESSCTQTIETNIDSYLYGNIWHCLYEKDGATLKSEESAVCTGFDREEEKEDINYYDQCAAQGYIKEKDDCYVDDLILYCPNDKSKVWCLDGKYCTGFNVGNIGGESACTIGAQKVDCQDTSRGKRCKYTYSDCNNCWYDGTYNPSAENCTNLDTSTKGDSEKCCKRGYRMENGICIVNVCDTELYPYVNQHPGRDQGEVETCYQGNPEVINTGVDVYYGYASCNSDFAAGGMWKPVGESGAEARQCICDRKNDTRGWLPFGADLYFDGNSDTTEDYIHVGFNKGAYGFQTSCTDSKGSYYGYSSCYIGSKSGETVSALAEGMCLSHSVQYNTTKYPMYKDHAHAFDHVKNVLKSVGISTIATPVKPTTNNIPDTSKVYCVNNTMHCKDGKGDESACALIKNPETQKVCENGYEEECTYCYHISNLTQENGKYKAHGKFKLIIQTYGNGGSWVFGFEQCPTTSTGGTYDYTTTWPTHGTCFKYCSVNDKSKCTLGDVLQDANGTNVGVVYRNTGSTLYVAGLEIRSDQTYEQAEKYAECYSPYPQRDTTEEEKEAGEKCDTVEKVRIENGFQHGQWALPTKDQMSDSVLQQYAMYVVYGTYLYNSFTTSTTFENSWTQTPNGSSAMYIRNCCSATTSYAKTGKRKAVPVKVIPY